jgi:hypothetical protein
MADKRINSGRIIQEDTCIERDIDCSPFKPMLTFKVRLKLTREAPIIAN